jgi:hypothetical protein
VGGFGGGFVPLSLLGTSHYRGDYYGLSAAEVELEREELKQHNEHVEEHVKQLQTRHLTYKGWAFTPYVYTYHGLATMKWKATKEGDKTFDGSTYAYVKLSILRYVDTAKWLDFLERHV